MWVQFGLIQLYTKFQPSTMSGTGQKVQCGGWWMKAALVFIFGPNLKTKTVLRPRPKLNKNQILGAKNVEILFP